MSNSPVPDNPGGKTPKRPVARRIKPWDVPGVYRERSGPIPSTIAATLCFLLCYGVFACILGAILTILSYEPSSDLEDWVACLAVNVPTAYLAYRLAQCYYWAARWEKPPPTDTRCRVCDYDLTGNVSGICPECGTPIPDDLWAYLALCRTDPAQLEPSLSQEPLSE